MSNAHCGDRHCVEDLSLTTNFYCDCRAKAAESYCKAHEWSTYQWTLFGQLQRWLQSPDPCVLRPSHRWRRLDGGSKKERWFWELSSQLGRLSNRIWAFTEQTLAWKLAMKKSNALTSHAWLKGSELWVEMSIVNQGEKSNVNRPCDEPNILILMWTQNKLGTRIWFHWKLKSQ